MKPHKLLLTASTLLTSGAIVTTVVADTYTTTVAIDYQTRTLGWQQNTPMQFATVVFNDQTVNGQTCFTHNNKKKLNTLCPGNRADVSNSDYAITGTPNTTVLINLDNTKSVIEGIEFQPILVGKSEVKLDNSGRASYDIGGQLRLLDGAATTSSNLTFSYDLEFTSQ